MSSNCGAHPCRHRHWFDRLWREVLAGIDEPVGFELVLLVVEGPVAPAERDELGVRAALDDLAVLENQNLVGAANGGEPVRDDEGRAPLPQRLQADRESRLKPATT